MSDKNNYYYSNKTEQQFNELKSIKQKFGWNKENVWDEPIFFPWIHVLDSKIIHDYIPIDTKACPICNSTINLQWAYFVSPKWTWEKMCGRAGYLSVCTSCER